MDIEQLYRDHGVHYVTENHKHARQGWVNVKCPFCTGNPGYHLGYDTIGNKFVCWRCGGKNASKAISSLLNVSYTEAHKILRTYGVLVKNTHEIKRTPKIKAFKLPSNSKPIEKNHKQYLLQRGFDPDEIAEKWGILGTGVLIKLDNIDYKHRIVIPYYWNNEIVSFDTRVINNTTSTKYLGCSLEREKIERKKILYGKQEKWGDVGICVEGTTDVWRLGYNAFATSGIKYTPAQVRLMTKFFKKVFVMFDDEDVAQKQAQKLVSDLKFRGVEAINVKIIGDPASLSQDEANYLIKKLISF